MCATQSQMSSLGTGFHGHDVRNPIRETKNTTLFASLGSVSKPARSSLSSDPFMPMASPGYARTSRLLPQDWIGLEHLPQLAQGHGMYLSNALFAQAGGLSNFLER